jgi:hypothetical protein
MLAAVAELPVFLRIASTSDSVLFSLFPRIFFLTTLESCDTVPKAFPDAAWLAGTMNNHRKARSVSHVSQDSKRFP